MSTVIICYLWFRLCGSIVGICQCRTLTGRSIWSRSPASGTTLRNLYFQVLTNTKKEILFQEYYPLHLWLFFFLYFCHIFGYITYLVHTFNQKNVVSTIETMANRWMKKKSTFVPQIIKWFPLYVYASSYCICDALWLLSLWIDFNRLMTLLDQLCSL